MSCTSPNYGTSRETDLLTLIGTMGIVASLAAIPVAEDIIRDERRRELQRLEDERLRRLRESGYRYGDLDLQLIKRLSVNIGDTEEFLGRDPTKFREGHTKVSDVEKIYLTGPYKQKYKTLSDVYNATPKRFYPVFEWTGGRKIRSAYPNVRLKPSHMQNPLYINGNHQSQAPSVKEITVKSTVF